jgi:hypothetical protein
MLFYLGVDPREIKIPGVHFQNKQRKSANNANLSNWLKCSKRKQLENTARVKRPRVFKSPDPKKTKSSKAMYSG